MSRSRFAKRRFASRRSIQCESLEERRLLTALVIHDTPNVDTITLSAAGNNGIVVILNGVETDYKPNQFDSVNINSSVGADTINVQATVVPTIVHYAANNVTVIVGSANGVQNIKADLNMNGVTGGPVADGTANIAINDTGDTAPRTVSLTSSGDKQIITGLAPAEISIGVSIHPLAAGTPGAPVGVEALALTTGGATDQLTISALRSSLQTSLYNAWGNDLIDIGNGSLAQIYSPVTVWGHSDPLLQGSSILKLDDKTDAAPAQFTVSAIYPPGPGAIVNMDFSGTAIPSQRVSFRVAEVSSAIINGGSGGNQFTINALPARSGADGSLSLNTGQGNDKVNINATALGTLVGVFNTGGSDAYVVSSIGPFAPTGVNGDLNLHGSTVDNDPGVTAQATLTIFGPQTNPLDIPAVPVIVTLNQVQHRDQTIHYEDIATLKLEHGNYQINGDLGPIALAIASEPSNISFESETEVTFNATQHLQSLTITAGQITLAAGAAIVLNTSALTMTDGTIDVADNSIQIHYTSPDPFVSIRKAIFAKQIKTSSADAHHALGYADSADNIVPNLPANTVLVTYALAGDASLDKTVGFADLVAVAQHYGQSTNANWDQGDFNFDGAVGFADLVVVAQNYGRTLSPVLSPALAVAALPVQTKIPSTAAATPAKKPVTKPTSAVRR
jgi:hypothetical protein